MIDCEHQNWTVHLKGAKDICCVLNIPLDEARDPTDNESPVRCFLASLLLYLDAAGASAASDGTIVTTTYWALDGLWWDDHTSATTWPSSCPSGSTSEETHFLTELRKSWWPMLRIQMSVSEFGKAKKGMMSIEEQDRTYKALIDRLLEWRRNAPEPLQQLCQVDRENVQQYKYPELIEQASYVEVFEMATRLYLHRIVAADRPARDTDNVLEERFVWRILFLVERFTAGVKQLALVWALFVAGQGAQHPNQQKFVRERLQALQPYGLKVCNPERLSRSELLEINSWI